MARAGLSPAVIGERAALLLDRAPETPLTLAAIADDLGVKAPSLYKHVPGLPGTLRLVRIHAKTGISTALEQATIGVSRDDAVRRLAHAYRDWARRHPGQYPLTVAAPGEQDDEDATVSARALHVLYRVLDEWHLHEDAAVDAARFLRAALHGFVTLESGGGFALPRDRDRSFERLVDGVLAAVQALAPAEIS